MKYVITAFAIMALFISGCNEYTTSIVTDELLADIEGLEGAYETFMPITPSLINREDNEDNESSDKAYTEDDLYRLEKLVVIIRRMSTGTYALHSGDKSATVMKVIKVGEHFYAEKTVETEDPTSGEKKTLYTLGQIELMDGYYLMTSLLMDRDQLDEKGISYSTEEKLIVDNKGVAAQELLSVTKPSAISYRYLKTGIEVQPQEE